MNSLFQSTAWRRFTIALIAVLAILAAALAWMSYTMHREQPQLFAEPVVDRKAPEVPPGLWRPAVLVFSKTNSYRHAEAIPAANALFADVAARRGWGVFLTENAAVFDPVLLAGFDVVVWNNATAPALTQSQRAALQDFIESGGGFVGVHAAGDNSHAEWPWYQDEVIRAKFIGHPLVPQFQDGTVTTEMPEHAAMRHLPRTWQHNEEWYSFAESPRGRGVDVLATVDERSYEPGRWLDGTPLAMGPDHPVIWAHDQGRGRVLYSALGHQAKTFDDPRYRELLEQAVIWAGGLAARADAPSR